MNISNLTKLEVFTSKGDDGAKTYHVEIDLIKKTAKFMNRNFYLLKNEKNKGMLNITATAIEQFKMNLQEINFPEWENDYQNFALYNTGFYLNVILHFDDLTKDIKGNHYTPPQWDKFKSAISEIIGQKFSES